MAEIPQAQRGSTPTLIPQKRPHGLEDEQHLPAVSSPLNPDPSASRSRKAAPAREPREKKDSLKKREAKGSDNTRSGTPDSQSQGRKTKKGSDTSTSTQSLIRYTIPMPKRHDFDPPGAPALVPSMTRAGRQFYESQEHVYNRKGFRYTHCIADPAFQSTNYHRQSETEPFIPRFDYEDSSSHVRFDKEARAVTTEKGFRMARANIGVREGRWYWECKVLSGVRNPNNPASIDDGAGGHVRLGYSRREASLDTPVGFDAYSYGIRDLKGEKVHKSRPQTFFQGEESICEGDIIGIEINLPSLTLHRKVVEGTYNKAVDVSDEVEPPGTHAPNIIRDRLPIRYKAQLYFEQFEYQSSKEMEELMYPPSNNSTTTSAASQAPNPNHPIVSLRTLPFSNIKIYKNGRFMGTAFSDLFAFLPLASKPATQIGVVGAREGLDDGMLAYFPAISVFQGGAAEANFGPSFWCPPPELLGDGDVDMMGDNNSTSTNLTSRRLRPLSERYKEQIAEDVVYDIVDEVDLWMEDGGRHDARPGTRTNAPSILGPVDSAAPGGDEAMTDAAAAIGTEPTGELTEIVQDDE